MRTELELFDKNMNVKENSLGYQQVITTLTAVSKRVSMQKFYEIAFADYIPVVYGNGAFQRQILNWRVFVTGEGFKTGVQSNMGNNTRMDLVGAAYDGLYQPIFNWAKGVQYSLFELQEALQANTLFSLIEARETARRKEWQLGLQEVAFKGFADQKGLLNLADPYVDTASLTKRLWNMTAAELNTFVGTIYQQYRVRCNYTAKPTHFVMPENDYNGLVNFPDAAFPLKTRIQILLEAFQTISGNPNFKILPCAYCDKANYDSTNNRYALYNYDETSLKMDLPLDLVTTASGTQDGFNWTNVAYGQFTGAITMRPLEMLYFSNTAT
jgi:hypothetical protein